MPAIHMLGGSSPSRKTYKTRGETSGREVEFIPERGMITIRMEQKDGTEKYDRVSRMTFLERAHALQAEVTWLRKEACRDSGRASRHLAEARIMQDLVDCMVDAAKAAGEQGDPITSIAQMAVNRTRIARPTYESAYSRMPVAPIGKPVQQVSPTLILPPGH